MFFLTVVAPMIDELARVTNTQSSLSWRRTYLAPHGKPHRFCPRFLVDGADAALTCFVLAVDTLAGRTSTQRNACFAEASFSDVDTLPANTTEIHPVGLGTFVGLWIKFTQACFAESSSHLSKFGFTVLRMTPNCRRRFDATVLRMTPNCRRRFDAHFL
jgi:hypothetical protein